MAAFSRIPSPGTKKGPCPADATCTHETCATMRKAAGATCLWCRFSIGYDTPYREEGENYPRPIHKACHDERQALVEGFDFSRITAKSVRVMKTSPAFELTLCVDGKAVLHARNDGRGGNNVYGPVGGQKVGAAWRWERDLDAAVQHALGTTFESLDHLVAPLADKAKDGAVALRIAHIVNDRMGKPEGDIPVGDLGYLGPTPEGEIVRVRLDKLAKREAFATQIEDATHSKAGTRWRVPASMTWREGTTDYAPKPATVTMSSGRASLAALLAGVGKPAGDTDA